MSPDELVLVSEAGCDRPRLGIVVMSRLPGKTLVSFGKAIETVSNENIKEVKRHVSQEGEYARIFPEERYMQAFPEIEKLQNLRCARCGRIIFLEYGLRRWPMNPVEDQFVCMNCEFELQLENGMYNK